MSQLVKVSATMLSNTVDGKERVLCGAWLWRRVALPLLLAVQAFGFVGLGAGLASPSAPLRPATVSHQSADSAPALDMYTGCHGILALACAIRMQ